jgi:hypothetical protein
MSFFFPRKFGPLVLIGLVAFSNPAGARENLWTITVAGGGSPEKTDVIFYQGMVNLNEAVQSFGVPPTMQKNYFGPSSGPLCYSEQTPEVKNHIQQVISQLHANPEDCGPVTEIINSQLGQFAGGKGQNRVCSQAPADIVKNLGRLGDNENFISGPANKKEILESLSNVTAAAAKVGGPKHLLLSLSDHGLKTGDEARPNWIVGLGDEHSEISVDELQPWLEKLRQAGVVVHLNVDACYSGGFNRLSVAGKGPGEGSVCSTSVTDENTLSSGSNDPVKNMYSEKFAKNLKKYRNQLQAHACSIGQDSWNRPQSSLDLIVKDWAKQRGKTVPACPGATNTGDLKSQLQDLVKIENMADPFRQALAEAYDTQFAKVLIDCVRDRGEDLALAEEMRACLVAGRTRVHPSIIPMVVEALSAQKAQDVDVAQISKDMQFIREADANYLKEFKTSFCCLAYDFKTGDVPSVCKL